MKAKPSPETLPLFPMSTSSSGAAPAKTCPSPGRGKASTAPSPASGFPCFASSAPSARPSCSGKTFLAPDGGAWTALSPVSAASVTRWSGPKSQPRTSAPPTCAEGSSSLPTYPTPSASSYGSNKGGAAGRTGEERLSLQSMATRGQWPTPSVKGNYNRAGLSPRSGDGLATAVLRAAGKQWPTPIASDATRGGGQSQTSRAEKTGAGLRNAVEGPLNPDWVELLMGFPQGWTKI